MSVLTNISRPTLALPFNRGRYRSDLLTNLRTTTKTRVNRFGLIESVPIDTQALNFDPATGECMGLSVEGGRTNLLQRSEEFDNIYWTPLNTTVTANNATAPDGTLTADLVYPSLSDTVKYNVRIGRFTSGLSTSVRTTSFYVKPSGWRWIYVVDASGAQVVWFDLLNGVIGTQEGAATGRISYNASTGYYRVSVNRNTSATSFYSWLCFSDNDNSTICTASGANGVHVWGAQIQTGSVATSYIPTTTASVTTGADILGTTNVDWLNQGRGTFFAKALRMNAGVLAPIFRAKNAGGTGIIEVYRDASNIVHGRIVSGGVTQADVQITNASTNINVALAYDTNNVRMSVNGVDVVSDVVATIPTDINELRIGNDGTNYLNANIAEMAYSPFPITSNDLKIYSR